MSPERMLEKNQPHTLPTTRTLHPATNTEMTGMTQKTEKKKGRDNYKIRHGGWVDKRYFKREESKSKDEEKNQTRPK